MPKYYVESGDLKTVIQATGPIAAAAAALSGIPADYILEARVTVNEQGFVRDRAPQASRRQDLALETGTLLWLISEHAFD